MWGDSCVTRGKEKGKSQGKHVDKTYTHPPFSTINLFRNDARQTHLAGRVLYLSAGRGG